MQNDLNEIEKEKMKEFVQGMQNNQIREFLKYIPSKYMWSELEMREIMLRSKIEQITAIL